MLPRILRVFGNQVSCSGERGLGFESNRGRLASGQACPTPTPVGKLRGVVRVKRGALLADDDLGGDVIEGSHYVGHCHWRRRLKRRRGRGVGGGSLCNILAIAEDDPLGITGRLEPLRAFLALGCECHPFSLAFKVLLLALPL